MRCLLPQLAAVSRLSRARVLCPHFFSPPLPPPLSHLPDRSDFHFFSFLFLPCFSLFLSFFSSPVVRQLLAADTRVAGAAPLPELTLSVPAEVAVGSAFTLALEFDNVAAPSDASPVGFGPFVDVFLPSAIDGAALSPPNLAPLPSPELFVHTFAIDGEVLPASRSPLFFFFVFLFSFWCVLVRITQVDVRLTWRRRSASNTRCCSLTRRRRATLPRRRRPARSAMCAATPARHSRHSRCHSRRTARSPLRCVATARTHIRHYTHTHRCTQNAQRPHHSFTHSTRRTQHNHLTQHTHDSHATSAASSCCLLPD